MCGVWFVFFNNFLHISPQRKNKQHSPISPGVINRFIKAHLGSSHTSQPCDLFSPSVGYESQLTLMLHEFGKWLFFGKVLFFFS